MAFLAEISGSARVRRSWIPWSCRGVSDFLMVSGWDMLKLGTRNPDSVYHLTSTYIIFPRMSKARTDDHAYFHVRER